MAFYKNLKEHFKKDDIITVIKVKDLFKLSYPWAKQLIIENEIKGIIQREEIGKENSKRQSYIWRLK
jgi:hypothetical protein